MIIQITFLSKRWTYTQWGILQAVLPPRRRSVDGYSNILMHFRFFYRMGVFYQFVQILIHNVILLHVAFIRDVNNVLRKKDLLLT